MPFFCLSSTMPGPGAPPSPRLRFLWQVWETRTVAFIHKAVIQSEAEGTQRKSCPRHVTFLDTPVLSAVTLAQIFVTMA